MDRKQKYDMYCKVLKAADRMGVAEKIDPKIAFDIGYVALANKWPYEKAIEWALENSTEEKVKGYTFVVLNEEAQQLANEAYEKVTSEIMCYRCGRSDKINGKDGWVIKQQYQHFSISFGYGSKHDMEQWSWTLCEDCLDDIVKTFKYEPNKEHM